MTDTLSKLAARLALVERELTRTSRTARLAYSSIENGAIEIHDDDGGVRGVIGQQPDGTTGAIVVNGPPPPTPSLPLVEPALAGLHVTWDGAFADALAAPLDLARVQVHLLPSADAVPDVRWPTATIEASSGASVTIARSSYEGLWVRLVAVNTSGIPGPASEAVTAKPRQTSRNDLAVGAVGPDNLVAGSVTAAALAADAITGKVVTGGVVQTGTSGTRLVMSPTAGGTGVPALALYSGHPQETAPGTVSSTTTTVGTALQPVARLEAPRVDSGHAELYLRSPAQGGLGSFELDANSARPFCYIKGSGATNTDASRIELFAQDGSSGPASVAIVEGAQVFLRSGLAKTVLTGDGLSVDGDTVRLNSLTVTKDGWLTRSGEAWKPIAFASGWTGYGSQYGVGRFRLYPDSTLALRDLIRRTQTSAPATGEVLFTLPAGYRPATSIQLNLHAGTAGAALSLNIGTAGTVTINNISSAAATYLSTGSGYLSLNNIRFPVD
ncbi:hypothetical protein OG427_02805 [Streptomyces sp. NBC_00133]|uniref:hypothetical protein n=1 Tax=Streptomyces sp. NBC_00133 TaxID=2903624 RepID=UPI00324DFE26